QLQGDLQSRKLEETFQPMSLHLSQVRTTYSSPSTLFGVTYLDVSYAHRFMKFHGYAKKNYLLYFKYNTFQERCQEKLIW
ncbi:MAG: hypothetical protein OXI63_15345, partial [Candidatus Poribacteria bacterium]|nr:hypothetical protein [Candidatus Poribacteria bacterium]